MIKKTSILVFLLIMLFNSTTIRAEEFKYAEIFDPKQNKVVKVVQLNAEIHNMVTSWLNDIDGIYGKFDPISDDGYAIRIPLDPAVRVQNKWVNTLVNEIYIIIPEKNPPFFIIFEDENKLLCFPFNGDISRLSNCLNFNLNNG